MAQTTRTIKPIKPRWQILTVGVLTLLVLALVKTWASPKPHTTLGEFVSEVTSLFVAELGVAFVIAFLISYTIDRQVRQQELDMKAEEDSKREQRLADDARLFEERRELEKAELQRRRDDEARENERRQKLIAENVVQGVYGIQHSPSYVKAVIETNLMPTVVRQDAELEYTVRELTQQEVDDLELEAGRFVVLEMVSSYRFRNLANFEQAINVRYSVAVRHGESARRFTRVTAVSIGGNALVDADILEGAARGERALRTKTSPDDSKSYLWPRKLDANALLPVTITVRSIKERSDNEVWGSFFPTVDGLRARFSVIEGMRFGLRPLTASEWVRSRTEKAMGIWNCTGSILPNDSVVFWWRTPEDDAESSP